MVQIDWEGLQNQYLNVPHQNRGQCHVVEYTEYYMHTVCSNGTVEYYENRSMYHDIINSRDIQP